MKEEEEEEKKSLSWLNGERGLSVFAVKESMVMVVLVESLETMVDGGLVLRLIRLSLPEIFIFYFIFIFIFIFGLYIYIYIFYNIKIS